MSRYPYLYSLGLRIRNLASWAVVPREGQSRSKGAQRERKRRKDDAN